MLYPSLSFRNGDSDALAYIAAVETADGQALESGVRSAITNFIVGCKSDGIWDAIKASCILAGARTLNGALQPLVGAVPTNPSNVFVGGDYDRKTGLVGNGSTKYLNSNHNNNADPQNNHHLAVYGTRNSSTNAHVWAGARLGGQDTGGRWLGTRSTTSLLAASYASMPNGDVNQGGGVVSVGSTVFTAFSRSTSSGYTSRVNAINTSQTQTSSSPVNASIFIFALNNAGTPAVYTDARIAFYSIGESLDLALLDTRVTDLITAFGAAIP